MGTTNFYDNYRIPGVAYARVLLQESGSIGGQRAVFVDISGLKGDLVAPPFGGVWANPFKGMSKIYAGDLFEFRTDEKGEHPKIYLLKTFKVKSQAAAVVNIYRDGYSHIPFVGDVLMKAPTTIEETAKAYTVQSVEETQDGDADVWKITFNTAIDTVTDGDVLVEAESEDESGSMLVKTINAVAPCDYDFFYAPMSGNSNDVDKVRVNITPMLHGTMYIHKMSVLPKCVLGLNKSRINGWYEV